MESVHTVMVVVEHIILNDCAYLIHHISHLTFRTPRRLHLVHNVRIGGDHRRRVLPFYLVELRLHLTTLFRKLDCRRAVLRIHKVLHHQSVTRIDEILGINAVLAEIPDKFRQVSLELSREDRIIILCLVLVLNGFKHLYLGIYGVYLRVYGVSL